MDVQAEKKSCAAAPDFTQNFSEPTQHNPDYSLWYTNDKNKIPLPTDTELLKRMGYADSLYAWLLLRAGYASELGYYIPKGNFTYAEISLDLGLSRPTVTTRLKFLTSLGLLSEEQYGGIKIFKFAPIEQVELFDKWIINALLKNVSIHNRIIQIYIYLCTCAQDFSGELYTSATKILKGLGYSTSPNDCCKRVADTLKAIEELGLFKVEYIRGKTHIYDMLH